MKNSNLSDEMCLLVREFNAAICVRSNNVSYVALAELISKGVLCHISHIFLNEEAKNRIDISTKFEEKQGEEYVNEEKTYKVYDIIEMACEHGFDYMRINDQLKLSRDDIRKLYIESNKAIQRG